MKIIFRENRYFYYIEFDSIRVESINSSHLKKLKDVPHLDSVKPLYHYFDSEINYKYPVYYELNGKILTKHEIYGTKAIKDYYVKDYTLVNLNILENEDNI